MSDGPDPLQRIGIWAAIVGAILTILATLSNLYFRRFILPNLRESLKKELELPAQNAAALQRIEELHAETRRQILSRIETQDSDVEKMRDLLRGNIADVARLAGRLEALEERVKAIADRTFDQGRR